MTKRLMEQVLAGENTSEIPVWIMRQAGRYLPEYKETRKQAGDFLSLCYDPDKATEVTLQPLRRFDFDAAILFSDILVIPQALGQKLWFAEGEGPKLEALKTFDDVKKLDESRIDDHLSPVYQTVQQIRSRLDDKITLIGFAGAPWTVSCYMLQGGGSKDFLAVKEFMFSKPDAYQALIDCLVDATSNYLIKQVDHGANVLQLFDSWASLLDPLSYQKFVVEPTKAIIEKVRAVHPEIKFIGFSRSAGANLVDYVEQTGINGAGLDTAIDRKWAKDNIQSKVAVQGNLDPAILRQGGNVLNSHVNQILEDLGDGPFIFNCGHGIIKDTPPEHVDQLVKIVKNYKR